MIRRPYLPPEAWDDAMQEGLVPAAKINYKGRKAVCDDYHVEIWGADDGGELYTANLAVLEDKKIVDMVYGHSYTDKDFIEWTLIPKDLDDYLRLSSFGKLTEV